MKAGIRIAWIKAKKAFLAVGYSGAVVVETSIRGWNGIFLLPDVAHPVVIEIDPRNRFRGNNRENNPQACDTSMWMASPAGWPSPRWTPKKDWRAISSFHC